MTGGPVSNRAHGRIAQQEILPILKGHFGLTEDLDTDTSEKLQRLHALVALPARSAEEAQELDALADELSQRSAELGTEIWLLRNGLAERAKRAS